jgi:hypothetical protein
MRPGVLVSVWMAWGLWWRTRLLGLGVWRYGPLGYFRRLRELNRTIDAILAAAVLDD